jgi:hypothetical protein
MNFVITPYERAGIIKFGMTRSENQRLLQSRVEEFDRMGEPWDIFNDLGIQIAYSYDSPYRCRAIMMERPANPIFQNRELLDGTSIEDLRIWLALMDNSLEVATEAVTSNKFGIGLSTEDYWDLGHEPPTTVLVFERGYYDDLSSSTQGEIYMEKLREDKIVNSAFWKKLDALHNTDVD